LTGLTGLTGFSEWVGFGGFGSRRLNSWTLPDLLSGVMEYWSNGYSNFSKRNSDSSLWLIELLFMVFELVDVCNPVTPELHHARKSPRTQMTG
jgi:hypothetical protein